MGALMLHSLLGAALTAAFLWLPNAYTAPVRKRWRLPAWLKPQLANSGCG